jgi:outer membrane beta-barrel protein
MQQRLLGRLSSVLLVCGALFSAADASAAYDDESGGGSAVVIQNRKFNMGHEFTLQLGALPLDAFFKGVAATGRYTLHLSELQAWEIHGSYSFNVETDLSKQLQENFGVQPSTLKQVLGVLETSYVMKPMYGKVSLFNRTLMYAELFADLGLTVSYWTDASFRPGPHIGGGVRIFITELLSVRLDARHAVVFDGVPVLDEKASFEQVLQLNAGVSFNFGGGA